MRLRALLEQVQNRGVSIDEAAAALAQLPFTELDVAKFDHHRALRCGFAEVVFGPGKEPADLVRIVETGLQSAPCILSTRLNEYQTAALKLRFPGCAHNARARTVRVGTSRPHPNSSEILVITAGTSDIPVAEEALETLTAFGATAKNLYDVGVAGLHRVLAALPRLRAAGAIICVAGMEGALPSVVGGLVACPVIAVPTSVGYGASFNGVTALLSMLNTCASGVSVVNIDNGFGAAMCALRMLNTHREDR